MTLSTDTSRPILGMRATVCFHEEGGEPRALDGEGLRRMTVFPGRSEESFSEAGYAALRAAKVDNMVLPLDSSRMEEPLVDEIEIVSVYTLHVALYALQNPTQENIARALTQIGVSGDCEEWIDHDSLDPLPVPPPSGWEA